MDLNELNARIAVLMEDTLRTVDPDDPDDTTTAEIASTMLREARQRQLRSLLGQLPVVHVPPRRENVARPRERRAGPRRRTASPSGDPDREPDLEPPPEAA